MTIIGSDYLLELAALSLAFVGFSAIVVTLRQAIGTGLTDIDIILVRLFIEGGLAVTAFGILPKALALTELPDLTMWRLSSAAAGLTFAVYLVVIFRRRRRAAPGPVPFRTAVNFVISTIATLFLWLNTFGFPFETHVAPYALTLTWFFVMGVLVFLQNLESFIERSRKRR